MDVALGRDDLAADLTGGGIENRSGTLTATSGTLELERVEVGPQLWKTALINIHFSGRMVLFKTINKEQFERRSDFQVVSSDLSLAEAKDLLVSRVPPSPQFLSTRK